MSEVITTTNDVAMIEQKRTSWGNMGAAIYKSELELQARSQEAILKITLPQAIDDVPTHEILLKEVKSIQATIEFDRKKITGKFDDLFKRLMQPEKSLNEPIKGLYDEIIRVKKSHEHEQRKNNLKIEELKKVKEKIANYLATVHADFLTKINGTVQDLYSYALGSGDITPDALPEYLSNSEGRLSVFDFQPKKPFIAAIYCHQATTNELVKELFTPRPSVEYVALFKRELSERFSDYDVAFENKQQGLLFAEKEKEEKIAAIEAQKQNANVAAKLDAISSQSLPVSGPVVKSLKQSYEIDMPETLESALSIMSAFVANVNLCLPKLKVNKWFAFTPAQAGIALAKVKCDDNNFQPSGIIFKTVDKL